MREPNACGTVVTAGTAVDGESWSKYHCRTMFVGEGGNLKIVMDLMIDFFFEEKI